MTHALLHGFPNWGQKFKLYNVACHTHAQKFTYSKLLRNAWVLTEGVDRCY